MSGIRWIKTFLFLTLELHFPALTTQVNSILIKEGDDAMLPCEHVRPDQVQCGHTNWIHTCPGKVMEDLVKNGRIKEELSHRLTISENCSLLIKKVTTQDRGRYDCRQSGSDNDILVYLTTVKMTEKKEDNEVTLSCSVSEHFLYSTVKCRPVEATESMESQYKCSVTFSGSFLKQNPNYQDLFICDVTDDYTKKVQTFSFSSPSSGEDPSTPTTESISSSNTNMTMSGQTPHMSLWWFVGGAVAGAALLLLCVVIVVLAVVRWKRNESKTHIYDDTGQRLNPTETQSGPQTSHNMADPEDGVSYASVSYVKRSNGKTEERAAAAAAAADDDDDEAVTYSTVNIVRQHQQDKQNT